MLRHHVVFIGDNAVGKTTLIHRIITGKFNPYVKTTIGCDFMSHIYFDDEMEHQVMFWDTCGRLGYVSLILPYISKADLVVVLYDTSKPCSLDEWLKYVPDGIGVLILPVIREAEGIPHDNSIHFVSKPVNIVTGDNVESFVKDMKKLLKGDVPEKRVRCGCIQI